MVLGSKGFVFILFQKNHPSMVARSVLLRGDEHWLKKQTYMVILRDLLVPQNSVLFAFVCNIKALVMGCIWDAVVFGGVGG